jgi:predicted GTPase
VSRWRILVVAALLLGPFALLAAVGYYYLWKEWGLAVGWGVTALLIVSYGLAAYWQRKQRLLRLPEPSAPHHWSDHDAEAWKLVEARAKAAAKLPRDKLSDPPFYFTTAQEMALELARFYHPHAKDPVEYLTIPEILAVTELVAHDLAELVDQYLPAGHLLTVKHWRWGQQAVDWYQRANNVYWAISAVFSPVNTAMRYGASQLGLSMPFQMLQQDLYLWFYVAYVQRLGTYLIDLHSGRLRVGASRYRELLEGRAAAPTPGAAVPEAPDPADLVKQVTVTLLGQVKVGKSSLINGLLGERRALADVLPATADVQRYTLQPPGIPSALILLDTVGYGHAGPRADQVQATREAARQSDLLLLVLHARNPARQADLDMLNGLKTWFAEHPELKQPPLLAVVTHVDLLSPALEWAPPYRWQEPTRPKEENIQQAVAAVREQLGPYLAGVVPVCVAPGKVYGVEEGLLPAIAEVLDEVHGVALLRTLRAEADAGKMRKVFHQLLATGKEAARVVWKSVTR